MPYTPPIAPVTFSRINIELVDRTFTVSATAHVLDQEHQLCESFEPTTEVDLMDLTTGALVTSAWSQYVGSVQAKP